jgi:hypothetical protein
MRKYTSDDLPFLRDGEVLFDRASASRYLEEHMQEEGRGTSVHVISLHTRNGTLPSYTIGIHRFWRKSDLDEFIRRRDIRRGRPRTS